MTKKQLFYVGTYNNMTWSRGQKGDGLYHLALDPATGQAEILGVTTGLVNPSFSIVSPGGDYVYTIEEVQPLDAFAIGRINVFRVDRATGDLTRLCLSSSYGLSPCYMTEDDGERLLFVSNFRGPTVVSLQLKQALITGKLDTVVHTGSGPKPRQQEARPHCVILDRAQRRLLVSDLGADKIKAYDICYETGKLHLVHEVSVDSGDGPRHLTMSAGGELLFATCELGSKVYCFGYDSETGELTFRQSVSSLPADVSPEGNSCGHLALSRDGKFLYATNRGNNSIAIFSVAPDTGRLTMVGLEPTGGETPRHFAMDPTENYLLVGNQDSNLLVVFRRDPRTGLLDRVSELAIPAPTHVLFL